LPENLQKVRKNLFWTAILVLLWSCSPSEQELFDEGLKLMDTEQYQKAIEYFDRVLEKNPGHTSAQNAKGVALVPTAKI
jgi:Flp pilus assembly protein TadD